jgi:arylsulfatase A-like enzyme
MAVDEGRAEQDVVRAKMIEHDEHVGALMKKIKDLGIEDDTIVVYTTDNGYELIFWPDAGYAPSAARRAPPGKAVSACRASSSGPAISSPAATRTAS